MLLQYVSLSRVSISRRVRVGRPSARKPAWFQLPMKNLPAAATHYFHKLCNLWVTCIGYVCPTTHAYATRRGRDAAGPPSPPPAWPVYISYERVPYSRRTTPAQTVSKGAHKGGLVQDSAFT